MAAVFHRFWVISFLLHRKLKECILYVWVIFTFKRIKLILCFLMKNKSKMAAIMFFRVFIEITHIYALYLLTIIRWINLLFFSTNDHRNISGKDLINCKKQNFIHNYDICLFTKHNICAKYTRRQRNRVDTENRPLLNEEKHSKKYMIIFY
jgi:hypothetical protein